jgi:hypothetical protein
VEIVPVLECAVPPPLVVADGPVDVALPVAERVRRVQTRRPLDICPRCWYKHNGWAGGQAHSRDLTCWTSGRPSVEHLPVGCGMQALRAFVKAAKSAMGDAVSDSD